MAFQLATAEVLQTGEAGFIQAAEGERTWTLSQEDIIASSGVGVARKRFNFTLTFGPYCCAFTRNGQHVLAGGEKGHVALVHCDSMQVACELHVKESVRAVQPLHNHLMFAVAQKKYLFIYDNQGVELHCLKRHRYPMHLEFLPYHYLLVSAGDFGELMYRDISSGEEVCCHKMNLGPPQCIRQNPANAVVHVGHTGGLVTLWTPTVKQAVVKMFCHRGGVRTLAVHDNYMVTAGADGAWKVFDLRRYDMLHSFRTRGHSAADLDVSMTGLVSIGFGDNVEVWKDVFLQARPEKPYMKDYYSGKMIESVRFRPFEDVLAVGHSDGFGSLIIPGAGVANFDSFEVNPYETKKQRREREVRSLLEKLQPDSIMLDPSRIGSIDQPTVKKWKEEQAQKAEGEAVAKKKATKKMRGRNKVGARLKRKHLKEAANQREKAKRRMAEGGEEQDDTSGGEGDGDDGDDDGEGGEAASTTEGRKAAPAGTGAALRRFYERRRRKT